MVEIYVKRIFNLRGKFVFDLRLSELTETIAGIELDGDTPQQWHLANSTTARRLSSLYSRAVMTITLFLHGHNSNEIDGLLELRNGNPLTTVEPLPATMSEVSQLLRD